jgi:hypothetical protein
MAPCFLKLVSVVDTQPSKSGRNTGALGRKARFSRHPDLESRQETASRGGSLGAIFPYKCGPMENGAQEADGATPFCLADE